MQTPGILQRLSFFIILNSLVIFAIVLIVSVENNQAKIDRLINYKFSFIGKYMRTEFGPHITARLDGPGSFTPSSFRRAQDTATSAIQHVRVDHGRIHVTVPE